MLPPTKLNGALITDELVRACANATARATGEIHESNKMINFKFLAIRLSTLDVRSRDAGGCVDPRCRRKPLCRFTAQVARLEDRLLMSKDVVLEMPQAFGSTEKKPIYNTVGSLSNVLFVSNSIVGATPMKAITITNNESHTIYPILDDPNTGKSTTGNYYDPIDMHNQEYRGYIGYTANGHDYLGLQAHHSVTIDVPLVFWDSGRAALATDPYSLLPKDPNTSKAIRNHQSILLLLLHSGW